MRKRPIRNRTPEEREFIYQAVIEGKSLDDINAQLPPEVQLPETSYDMITRAEARAIKEGRTTIKELARRPRRQTDLHDLLK